MKLFALILMLAAPILHDPFEGRPPENPEINMLYPRDGENFRGVFVMEVKNFDYAPEFATNAVTEFAIGEDNRGLPLVFGEGHAHGWIFKVGSDGEMIRDDAGQPTPGSYERFYGASSGYYFGTRESAYLVFFDSFEKGTYKAFFQLQQNDHTGALQATAPAFPGIASAVFEVKNRKGRSD